MSGGIIRSDSRVVDLSLAAGDGSTEPIQTALWKWNNHYALRNLQMPRPDTVRQIKRHLPRPLQSTADTHNHTHTSGRVDEMGACVAIPGKSGLESMHQGYRAGLGGVPRNPRCHLQR